ncbi:MAG: aldehyde dehydrogenase family protein, partial [Kiloniellales bacterium]
MPAQRAVKLERAAALAGLRDATLFREFAYSGGEWRAARSGRSIEVSNPANGDWIGAVPALSGDESRAAVDAAERCFSSWAARLPQERATVLRRWYELIRESREDLALIMTLEQGKPISEARGEIDYAASFVEFYAEEAKRASAESLPSHLPHSETWVRREPAGIAALVTPWNFPSAMITRKAAAALAAGCTVVLK